ncbi:MAG: protein kinase [Myxococcales bacterium]|nr:protein kinase [Myxococcales bacterium]
MALSNDRILVRGTSPHQHEREAVEFAIKALPDTAPYVLWALVDLVDGSGRRYDLDLVVIGFHALYVVEIKSHPGRISGDVVDWVITFPEGGTTRIENPNRLNNHKAKVLASMLQKRWRYHDRPAPWVQSLVFASAENVDVQLEGAARHHVVTRQSFARALQFGEYPGVDARSLKFPLNGPQVRETARILQEIGLRESATKRKVGDLVLGKLLVEHDGYQDHLAENEAIKDIKARVRTYQIPEGSGLEQRTSLIRAAEREARVLTVLSDHPNILKLRNYVTEGPMGAPAVVFDSFEGGMPLDAFLRAHPDLDLNERTGIIARIAEALAYCHRKSYLHRNLGPSSVLVRRNPDDEKLEIRLFNFQLAKVTDTSTTTIHSTMHLTAWREVSEEIYVAPEVLENPNKASRQSDIFSLGALAYLILVGRPPGRNLVEREALLKRGYLSPATARDGLAEGDVGGVGGGPEGVVESRGLEDVMEMATSRNLVIRADDAAEWADLLIDAVTAPTPEPEASHVHPLEARKNDVIGPNMLVTGVLGSGSTARTLRVDMEGGTFALKVALSADHDARLQDEADVLELLDKDRGSDRIVKLHGVHKVGGRTCLRLTYAGRTLARELSEEGVLSLDYARRWGEDLLLALEHLEERGVQHRDIKPANLGVLEGDQKKKRHLMLFDFSLSKADAQEIRQGTPAYRDPFLPARGRWDDHADRYAAAITLHEILTGERPRWGEHDTASATDAEITLAAERFDATIREGLVGFFKKALARGLKDRFSSADEMRLEWVRSIAPPSRARVVEASAEVADPVAVGGPQGPLALPPGLNLNTSVEALPLPARAKNALYRAGVLRVEDLLRLPNNQLSAMRGVGRGTAREILEFVQRPEFDGLRAALASSVAGLVRFAPDYAGGPIPLHVVESLSAAAVDRLRLAGLLDLQAVAGASAPVVAQILSDCAGEAEKLKATMGAAWVREFAQQRSLDTWLEAALPDPARAKGSGKPLLYVRQLFGLDAVKGGYVDSVAKLAADLGVTRPLIYQAVAKLKEGWLALPFLDQLQALVTASLPPGEDMAPLSRVARALSESLSGGPAAGGDRVKRATALVRVAVETNEDLVLGRVRDQLWLGRVGCDFGPLQQLGDEADKLALAEPLLSPGFAKERLRQAVRGTSLAGLADEPLMGLAVAASTKAASSARMEIYPRGLQGGRALDLSLASLPPRGLDAASVRQIVAARYPDAEALPEDGALRGLMEARGYRFDVATGQFGRPTSVLVRSTEAPSTRMATTHTGHREKVDPEAFEFNRDIEVRVKNRRFCVLEVLPGLAVRAGAELAGRLGVAPRDLEAELLAAADRLMAADGVQVGTVYEADRVGPAGGEWDQLTGLMDDAAGVVLEALKQERAPLVLMNPGLLARYGLTGFLKGLIAHAGDHDDAPAIFLIVPSAGDGGARISHPLRDLPIPIISPAQRLRVPGNWLKNLDRGRYPSA